VSTGVPCPSGTIEREEWIVSAGGSYEGRVELYQGQVRGIADEAAPPYHRYLDEALKAAVDQIPNGPDGWYRAEVFAYVRHGSPGWIDGFSARLSPGPG
jgi:hypothetical protein